MSCDSNIDTKPKGGQMNNLNQSLNAPHLKIRFRCPSCSKLFVSNPKNIYVEKPEFKCTSCEQDFSISLMEALKSDYVIGKKIKKKPEAPEEVSELQVVVKPKNNGKKSWELNTKPSQNFSFEDFDFQETKSKKEVLWQEVLKDYKNTENHKIFVKHCEASGEADFAKYKYSKILQANPFDEVASKCFNMICINEDTQAILNKEKRVSQFKIPFFMLTAVLLGISLVVLGLILKPQYQNLTGLGFGIIIFTLAIKALFQSKAQKY